LFCITHGFADPLLFILCSDQVMGGVSMARLTREVYDGRVANVLRGYVKMDNNGGFIQMATNLKRDGTAVDLSTYDGLELLVQSGSDQTESFNIQYDYCCRYCPSRWAIRVLTLPLAFSFLRYSLFFFVIIVVGQRQDDQLFATLFVVPLHL
jgi:hypothetical protein